MSGLASHGAPSPTTIVIAATGGQGGGVLSGWIVDIAEHDGYLAQATSVPGVAQRTGATIYYIELFPRDARDQAGRNPVLALMPVPGQVDILMASELMEAGRALLRGLTTKERTAVLISSHREYAVGEKAALGDGRADGARVLAALDKNSKHLLAFDMARLAAETGSVISSVMLGALAGSAQLPFADEAYESAIKRSGIAVLKNLAGFAAGLARARGGAEAAAPMKPAEGEKAIPLSTRVQVLAVRIEEQFPKPARPLIRAGVARVSDFQDLRLGGEYLDRLATISALDHGGGDGGYQLTAETARHLALWMSYEDAIRVADLKIRSERFQRVRGEARASPGELVSVVEFLHPRVEEISDIMPAWLGRFMAQNKLARLLLGKLLGRGRQVPSTKLGGFLLLYGLASLRRFRRWSYRYKKEQALIARWLSRIAASAESDYELALAIAKCQRLIKGYGDTHARGLKNFQAVMSFLDGPGSSRDPAARVRQLTEAALADEKGTTLASLLQPATSAPASAK